MTHPRAIDQARSPAVGLGHAILALGVCVASATGNSSPTAHVWSGALVGLVAGWLLVRVRLLTGRHPTLRRASGSHRTDMSRARSAGRPAADAIRVALFLGLLLAVGSGLVLRATALADGSGATAPWRPLHGGLVDATLLVIAIHVAAVARTHRFGSRNRGAARGSAGWIDARVRRDDTGNDHGDPGA
jgi:cytochrome b